MKKCFDSISLWWRLVMSKSVAVTNISDDITEKSTAAQRHVLFLHTYHSVCSSETGKDSVSTSTLRAFHLTSPLLHSKSEMHKKVLNTARGCIP